MLRARYPLLIFCFLLALAFSSPVFASPLEEAESAYLRKDYSAALFLWEKLAENGCAEAQVTLANFYDKVPSRLRQSSTSSIIPRDTAKAAEWYRKAAEQNHPLAQYKLGVIYLRGAKAQRNEPEALRLIQLSAEQGYKYAQLDLARIYESGKSIQQDLIQSYKWYSLANIQKDPPRRHPQFSTYLTQASERGKSSVASKMTSEQIAQGDDLVIQWQSAQKENSFESNSKDQKDKCDLPVAKAVSSVPIECEGAPVTDEEYILALAHQGNPRAQYEAGERITKQIVPSYKQTLSYSRQDAINKGHEAKEWFQKSADQGYADAIYRTCYTSHTFERCKQLAEAGRSSAQINLGNYYFKGEEVAQSYEEAHFWYTLSRQITKNSTAAKKTLTAQQLSSIQERVNAWKPTPIPHISQQAVDLPINVAGLLCGAKIGCKIEDTCGDLMGITCQPSRYTQKLYHIASKQDKKVLSSCSFSEPWFQQEEGCKNLLPTEWTCNSPKNMPLKAEDTQKYADIINGTEYVISCGDILLINNLRELKYVNKITREVLPYTCQYGVEMPYCERPAAWTCGLPSYLPP